MQFIQSLIINICYSITLFLVSDFINLLTYQKIKWDEKIEGVIMKEEALKRFILAIQYTADTDTIEVIRTQSRLRGFHQDAVVWGEAEEIDYAYDEPLGWKLILPDVDNPILLNHAFQIWKAFDKTFVKELTRIKNKAEDLKRRARKWNSETLKAFWLSTPDTISLDGDWKFSPSELNPGKYKIEFLEYEGLWDTADGWDIPYYNSAGSREGVKTIGWKINWPTEQGHAILFEDGLLLWLAMCKAQAKLAEFHGIYSTQYF